MRQVNYRITLFNRYKTLKVLKLKGGQIFHTHTFNQYKILSSSIVFNKYRCPSTSKNHELVISVQFIRRLTEDCLGIKYLEIIISYGSLKLIKYHFKLRINNIWECSAPHSPPFYSTK